jgi:type IV fimbrial biogenesis protein FimT
MSTRNHRSGFTLVELLVTLAIVAIVATVGVPAYGTLIEGMRLAGAAGELHQALLYARSEAAKRGRNVVIESKGGTAWGAGWRVRDATTNEVLRDVPSLLGGLTVTGSAASLTYAPHGRPSAAVTLTVCPASGTGRQITVNTLGRPATADAAC